MQREGHPALTPALEDVLDRAFAREREYVLDASYPREEYDTTNLATLERSYSALVSRIRDEFWLDNLDSVR